MSRFEVNTALLLYNTLTPVLLGGCGLRCLFPVVQLLITIAFTQPVKLFSMKLQSSDFGECLKVLLAPPVIWPRYEGFLSCPVVPVSAQPKPLK